MRYTLAHAALICRRSFDVQYCGDARALSTKPNKKVPTSVSSPPQVGTKQSALRTKGHETFSRRQGPVGYVSAALLPDDRPRLEESNWFLTFPSGAALTREKVPPRVPQAGTRIKSASKDMGSLRSGAPRVDTWVNTGGWTGSVTLSGRRGS